MHPGNDIGVQLRLFFALWPDGEPLAALGRIARDVAQACHGRASPEENLHVTMAFIGDVHGTRLPRLQALGEEVASGSTRFDLALERLGGTAHGIAWLAPGKVPVELLALHERLGERLHAGGFPIERRAFRPHVTLARHCARHVQHRETPAVNWPVTRMSLIVSTLGPGSARYAELAVWRLGGRAGKAA